MIKTNIKRIIGGFIIIIIIMIMVVIIAGGKHTDKSETVGFIIPGFCNDPGYMSEHYMGISAACNELGLNLEVAENVADTNIGECKSVVNKMVQDGIKVIILGSYGYQVEMIDLLDSYPDVSFYCSADMDGSNNYLFYFSRVYQGRYMAGILAGMTTKTDRIGYIAAFDNCEVNRGINAFTLGVKAVNPDAVVYVSWTGSWDNEEIEKAHTKELIENIGVDVITYHQNKPYVLDEAEAHGIYSIGYNLDISGYSDHVLGSVRCNWSIIYKKILQDNFQNGGATKSMFWIGMEEDAVYLTDYSSLVSDDIKTTIITKTSDIKNGFDVFSGEIWDNEGNKRCNEGENMSDHSMMSDMNWFVDGVVFYE